jgi:DNA-binding NarL/FixJ family response regulator
MFRASAVLTRNVVVIVVDADQLGISTIKDLHAIFPDVHILALSRDASVLAHAVPAGATVALPTATSTSQLAKMVARLAAGA